MEVPHVFCLYSKQFESRMRSNLTDLHVGKYFCDVTIGCDDQEIEAHKVVLAGGSLLFNNLLKQNPHHHPFIFLRGINFMYLSKILDFLYQGEVYIDKNELDDFFSVAKDLKINGLTEDSKQSKHFVEEGAKTKRPRLTKSPEQDLNLDDYGICTEMDDFGSEPKTESFVNSDDKTKDADVEQVMLSDQLVAETPLTIPSGDQKVYGKLRIRDMAKLTKNPLQTKSYLMEQDTSKNDFTCVQCNKNYGNKYFLKSHIDSVHNGNGNHSTQDLKINCLTKDAVGDSNQSQEGSKIKSQRLLGIGRDLCFEVKMDDFGSEPITQSFVDFGDDNENIDIEKVSLPDKLVVKKYLKVDIRKLRMEDIEKFTKNPLQIQSSSIEKNNSENDFTCEQCNKSYNNKYYLKHHIDSVHNGNYFPCEQCNKKFSNKHNLQRHIGADHNGVLYSCEECDFKTKWKDYLKHHIDSVHNGNDFPCEKCNKKFTNKQNLQRHIADHNGALYSCEECDFKTKWKNSLTSHIDSAHNDDRVLHSCEKCKYTTKWKSGLQVHINSVHNEVLYSCEKCPFKTKSKQTLKNHIDSHNGISYSCENCDYTTFDHRRLRSHVLSIHNGNGYEGVLYSCELCDHKATKKIHLERHIKSSHKGSQDL